MSNIDSVIFETSSQHQQYHVIVDWENVEEKPNNLVTVLELTAKGYLNKQQVQKQINNALKQIIFYKGEAEKL